MRNFCIATGHVIKYRMKFIHWGGIRTFFSSFIYEFQVNCKTSGGSDVNLFQRLTEMAERMSPRKLFAVCAAIAIIVFAIIYMLLSSLLESPAGAQQASVTAVVEAAQDIPANTVITDDMVKTVNINSEAMPKGAFTDVRAAIGKTVSVPMQEGDVLTARKVSARGPSGFLGLIPPGMRAISFGREEKLCYSRFMITTAMYISAKRVRT